MATLFTMGRTKLGKVKANLLLPPEVKAAAERQADAEGHPLSVLVENLLRDYLDMPKPVLKRLPPAKSPIPKPPKRKARP